MMRAFFFVSPPPPLPSLPSLSSPSFADFDLFHFGLLLGWKGRALVPPEPAIEQVLVFSAKMAGSMYLYHGVGYTIRPRTVFSCSIIVLLVCAWHRRTCLWWMATAVAAASARQPYQACPACTQAPESCLPGHAGAKYRILSPPPCPALRVDVMLSSMDAPAHLQPPASLNHTATLLSRPVQS